MPRLLTQGCKRQCRGYACIVATVCPVMGVPAAVFKHNGTKVLRAAAEGLLEQLSWHASVFGGKGTWAVCLDMFGSEQDALRQDAKGSLPHGKRSRCPSFISRSPVGGVGSIHTSTQYDLSPFTKVIALRPHHFGVRDTVNTSCLNASIIHKIIQDLLCQEKWAWAKLSSLLVRPLPGMKVFQGLFLYFMIQQLTNGIILGAGTPSKGLIYSARCPLSPSHQLWKSLMSFGTISIEGFENSPIAEQPIAGWIEPFLGYWLFEYHEV